MMSVSQDIGLHRRGDERLARCLGIALAAQAGEADAARFGVFRPLLRALGPMIDQDFGGADSGADREADMAVSAGVDRERLFPSPFCHARKRACDTEVAAV